MPLPLIPDSLVRQIERDIRNQVLIDQLKRLNWKGRLMVYLNRNYLLLAASAVFVLWCMFAAKAFAAECPNPGEKCKVLFLNEQEEKGLTGQNGILDTAAQARNLDLGAFAVYLKTRIAGAPEGEVKKIPDQALPAAPKVGKPVDSPKK